MKCKHCGAPISAHHSKCPYCDNPISCSMDDIESMDMSHGYKTVEFHREVESFRDSNGRLQTVMGRQKRKVTFVEE